MILGDTREARIARRILRRFGECVEYDSPSWGAKNCVRAIIDARHPYAPTENEAPKSIPSLRLIRPPWTPTSVDRWIESPSAEAIIQRLLPYKTVFVTLGRAEETPFWRDAARRYVMRAREAAPARHPRHVSYESGTGPFDVEGEQALFRRLGIEALVTRNDGRRGAVPKILAARGLGLPVFMLARPPIQGPFVTCPRRAARWALLTRQAAKISGKPPSV